MEGFLPIILAIVFAAFSLFSRKTKQNEESEKRKPLIPPKLDPMHPQHYDKRPRELQPKPVESKQKRDIGIDVAQLSSPINPYKNRSNAGNYNEIKKAPPSPTFQVQNITKGNLIQGVVMAEILGAPRSRKPHHSSRRRKLPN